MNKITLKKEPTLLKLKDFSTIHFSLIFKTDYVEDKILYPELINRLIITSCFDYKTGQLFSEAFVDNLAIYYEMYEIRKPDAVYLDFQFTLPNPKVLKDYDLKSSFSLIMNSILKPNTDGDKFTDYAFNHEINYLKDYFKDFKNDYYNLIYGLFYEAINPRLRSDFRIFHLDTLDKITSKDIYSYYKENVLNNSGLLYIQGDLTREEVKDLTSDYFVIDKEKLIVPSNYDFLKPRKTTQFVEKKFPITTSILYLGYIKEDMVESDLKYLILLDDILSLSAGLSPLYKKLRIDNNLIYDASSRIDKDYGILEIFVSLNVSKKDIILKLIEECFQELQDKNNLKKYVDEAINNFKLFLKRHAEYRQDKMSDRISKDLKLDSYSAFDLKMYQEVDIDLFANYISKLKLDTIYLAEGELDERN